MNIERTPLTIREHATKVRLFLQANSTRIYKLITVLSLILLISTALYSGYKTSNYFQTNADAIIATQQFSPGVLGNTVALPASHTNILMVPLLYLQGHLTYEYKSFTLLNILLVLATVIAWAALLIKLFGRRFAPLIFITLASLMFLSIKFNLSIGNTTFRNIAYPISLWFVIILNDVLRGRKKTGIRLAAAVAGSILFCLLIAGDSFFYFSLVLPLLVVLVWYCFKIKKISQDMLRAIFLLVGIVAVAHVIKLVISSLGIIYFDTTFLAPAAILRSELLGPSIQIALRQIMELQGGSIFGLTLTMNNAAIFFNLIVLVAGLSGLIMILHQASIRLKSSERKIIDYDFVFVVLAVSYFTIVAEYILSGYVVTKLSNGQVIDYMNERYITFLPLITILGFVWLVRARFDRLRYIIAICAVLFFGTLFSVHNVRASYREAEMVRASPSQRDVDYIIAELTNNNVHHVVTDFWYGPPIRFRSQNSITYAPQINCKYPLSFDSREDWYAPLPRIKSALIIDRGGMNYGYWSCTDEDLMRIYGKPKKQILASGVRSEDVVKIWLYDYDVRQRLLPFPK